MRAQTKWGIRVVGAIVIAAGLAFWQRNRVGLASVAHPIRHENLGIQKLRWLSSEELLLVSVDEVHSINLKSQKERRMPIALGVSTRVVEPHSYTCSPDGKWVLFVERLATSKSPTWLLVHPDGTGHRRFTLPKVVPLPPDPLWLPDSRGWVVYGAPSGGRTVYSIDAAQPLREEKPETGAWLAPESIQADGRLLFQKDRNRTQFSLCSPQNPTECEEFRSPLPPGRENATIQEARLSPDNQTVVVCLRIPAITIPQRAAWQEFLHIPLPTHYDELWALPRHGGKPRRLIQEPTTNNEDNKITGLSIEGFSPDSKRLLLRQALRYFYLTLQ